jgi:hypothetical protein
MSAKNHIPDTVSAHLEARLAPFSGSEPATTEDNGNGLGLIKDLKLLFASLGAGNSVVPLGDNSRPALLLAEYARSLRCSI